MYKRQVLVGTQITLTVGLAAVAISLTVGVILGSIAGYKGGKWDTVIMRIMDMMLAIPSILLAIAIMAALGPGIEKAVVAIGLVAIPEYARDVYKRQVSTLLWFLRACLALMAWSYLNLP